MVRPDVVRVERPLVDADAFVLGRLRGVADDRRQEEWQARTIGHRLTGLEVEMLAGQEDRVAPVVRVQDVGRPARTRHGQRLHARGVECIVRLGDGREAVPGAADPRVVVHGTVEEVVVPAVPILRQVLHDEDDFRREVVVGTEIRLPLGGQAVDAGVQDPVCRRDRIVPARLSALQARLRHGPGEHLGIEVHARQNGIGRPPGHAPVRAGIAGGREHFARCLQLALDELEQLRPGRSLTRLDLRVLHDGYAPEHVHQHVVVERAHGANLRLDDLLVGDRDIRQHAQQHVRPRDRAERIVPHPVDILTRGTAGRPCMAVHLQPAAAIVPVVAARRHDDLVRRDLAQVVVAPERGAQAVVDGGEAAAYLVGVAVEVLRRDHTQRRLIEIRAPRREQQRQRETRRSDASAHACVVHNPPVPIE